MCDRCARGNDIENPGCGLYAQPLPFFEIHHDSVGLASGDRADVSVHKKHVGRAFRMHVAVFVSDIIEATGMAAENDDGGSGGHKVFRGWRRSGLGRDKSCSG